MGLWEIVFIGAALALDAVAVGMADGMAEPKMPPLKTLSVALAFGLFQGAMPLMGYYGGYALASVIGKVAPYIAFAVLALLGGKMIFGGVRELQGGRGGLLVKKETLGAGKLLMQSIATSIDALAVGIAFLAEGNALPAPVPLLGLVIAAVTFCMSLAAVQMGKLAGAKYDGAELLGGFVLVLIGTKILLEGVL